MRMKSLIVVLLFLLTVASLARAQEATVEPTSEATLEVEGIESAPVEAATAEATETVDHSDEDAATEDHSEDGATATDEAAGDDHAAETDEAPAGTALLMLLLGIGVVVLVGGATMFRRGSAPKS